MRSATAGVVAIIAATLVAQILIPSEGWSAWLLSSPGVRDGEVWRLVSYSLIHGNVVHAGFNLFGLLVFGQEVEHRHGGRGMLTVYVVGVVLSALLMVVVLNPSIPSVGASGGVYALGAVFVLDKQAAAPSTRSRLVPLSLPGLAVLSDWWLATAMDPRILWQAHGFSILAGAAWWLIWGRGR